MKVAVIYASTTGNTEAMANAICDSLKEKGAEVLCATADGADQAAALSCDVLLLGSPAMGDEVLEDSVEEFFAAIEGSISGKKIGIFGSYDWGDGKWLRDWADRIKSQDAVLLGEPLMVHLTPEADDVAKCKSWAAAALSA
ncbi:MAG: flavodoxin [Treponema sp.]|nr:flavodoxin [Treponema sp.]MEE3435973.1 flavodoxin [Treponema sp.]